MAIFKVTGSGPFPLDMLRYDRCWPNSSDDALEMTGPQQRTIWLRSDDKTVPTVTRWQTFGWTAVRDAGTRRTAV